VTHSAELFLGVIAGASGLDHGLFEVLQGNHATHSLTVQAIGPAQRMWPYGTEDAVTLVPNFLVTGMLAMSLSLLIVAWSAWFIDTPHGPHVFVALGALLFLTGGGVALVGFVVLCWAVSTRIGRPLASPRTRALASARRELSRLWLAALVASVAFAGFALEIAIFGYVPGISNPDQAQAICWSSLGAMLVFLFFAVVGGFEHDSSARTREDVSAHAR